MKLDLLNKNWLDLVFEGRNKAYGAYELRKNSANNTVKGFIIGVNDCRGNFKRRIRENLETLTT